MSEAVYFEDLDVGAEIPTLVKHPTTRQLVKWAGASGDYNEMHYDKDFAQKHGLPGVIVHGYLTFSFLGIMMTNWIGEKGILKKISCSYRGMHVPGEDIACKGRVTSKYVKNGENYVECDIWAENTKGDKTTPGKATVTLPSRAVVEPGKREGVKGDFGRRLA